MIEVRNLTKVFGEGRAADEAVRLAGEGLGRSEIQRRTGATLAVHDVSFDIADGELFVIMGLSGSGKSTLVRLLNRLIEPTSGSITVDGRDLGSLGAADLRTLRNERIAMVFQHFALLPHRTVAQNAEYGLQIRGVDARTRREKAEWALDQVGLGDRADALPGQLSGGMQQRVGLARALASDTEVLLMDEPYSALDPLIRRDMQQLLVRLQRDLKKTIVFITHNLNEAMLLGDRILLLKDGRLVQVGTGPQILASPADDYVADFVSDVDRSRVLTAADVIRAARITVTLDERPADVLVRLGKAEATGAYVVDDDQRILGVVRDDWLGHAAGRNATGIDRSALVEEYRTTEPDRPLIDLLHQVGRNPVPLAVVDDGRLTGVVPRGAVLAALSTHDEATADGRNA
ncbi:L-proline glycine betaine ABC transport system permease protein ProV [Pseudonocardia sp. Ae406_Ps2]|uniref:quaternary amine ABC transporter ATP-binding protein n=1 Tax=unclassified Pseudonocardia TaxID=2619320 RepID=UPI00094AD04F|nr:MULTISPECIES: glycine betaine/L-proline ABC transporter ATP-binding protein [unclassified Pseudonocardia]OLM01345.1 L-proline glycine betaine ABC transport system permease protein ProV [Pseudonocardia sp. Ae406_Ps2]OLM06859.1 L-proline glycine betaine ABC transport system permease protein ProV [Pseudonocardia sp. Ae331_Ps2]OLM22917.1 L-proline glycine betaine ABC transport system permease protein ProV [Pseudonocardia sp. Ae706_Ps2]